jgi:hypothetical protein
MPFTPAHASIVLPFISYNHRYVSATALVIGSMAPDFEYFIRMSVRGEYGHTVWGILFFDIPITLILALLFHGVVKQNLLSNLPVYFQSRLQPLLTFRFIPYLKKHFIVFAICAGVGAASHVLWDDFTHNDGYFVKEVPLVQGYYVYIFKQHQPLWHVLQHGSTMIGLIIIAIYIAKIKPDHSAPNTRPSLAYWLYFLIIAGIAVMIRFVIKSSDYNFGNLVVVTISAMCLASVICGLIPQRQIQPKQ